MQRQVQGFTRCKEFPIPSSTRHTTLATIAGGPASLLSLTSRTAATRRSPVASLSFPAPLPLLAVDTSHT